MRRIFPHLENLYFNRDVLNYLKVKVNVFTVFPVSFSTLVLFDSLF